MIPTGSECGFRVTKAEPDTAVFFTRCSFTAILLLPLSLRADAICGFHDGAHITNYTAPPRLLSLVNTDIHQYPISPSRSRRLHPPGPSPSTENLLLLLFNAPVFIEAKRALILACTLQDKRIAPAVAVATVALADDPVIVGHVPDSRGCCDINDSDEQTDRLQANNIKALLELKVFDAGSVFLGCCLQRKCHFHPRLLSKGTQTSAGALGPDRGGPRGQRPTSAARRGFSYQLQGQGQRPG